MSDDKKSEIIELRFQAGTGDDRIEWIAPGTMIHDEDAWCQVCMKTTIWYGVLHGLSANGVTVVGTTRGCHICKDWVRTDVNSKIIDLPVREPHKDEL